MNNKNTTFSGDCSAIKLRGLNPDNPKIRTKYNKIMKRTTKFSNDTKYQSNCCSISKDKITKVFLLFDYKTFVDILSFSMSPTLTQTQKCVWNSI